MPFLLGFCALLSYFSRGRLKCDAENAEVNPQTLFTTRKERKLLKKQRAALGKKLRKRGVTKRIPAFMFQVLRCIVIGLTGIIDHYQIMLCMFSVVCYQSDAKSMVPHYLNCVRLHWLGVWRSSRVFLQGSRAAIMAVGKVTLDIIRMRGSPAVCLYGSWLYHMRLVGCGEA